MLKPIKKNVIVEAIKKEKVTDSGIILTDVDREEATKGRILAIGNEVTEVKEGDLILPNWQKARKSTLDNEEFWVINEDDIILVFEGE